MKAAGYIRLSMFDDAATGPARQRADLQRLADSHGWQLDIYEDIDRSAYSGVARPAYDRMMANLGDYNILACWKVDRMLRRARDLPAIQDACRAHGVEFHSATEGRLGGGPGGDFILGLFAGLAELESATISLRVRSSQDHLLAEGRWIGGVVPYGYRAVDNPQGPGRVLQVDDDQAAVLAEACRRVVAGESARSIAWDLNERGVVSTRGGPWSSRVLARMLRSSVLIGQVNRGGKVLVGDDGMPLQVRPPAVDPFLWRRTVAELDARTTGPRRRAGSTLLGGLVTCGRCGSSMFGWTRDTAQASYTCNARSQFGPDVCGGNSINRRRLDRLVTAAVAEAITPQRIAQARRRLAEAQRPDPTATRIAQVEDALARLEHDRQVLGLYDDDEARYVARWKAYTDELAQLRESRPKVGMSVADLDPDVDLTALPTDRLRPVMLAAVAEVVIGPMAGQKRWEPQRVERIRWTWET